MVHDLSRDKVASASEGFTGRARNGQRIWVGSSTGTADSRCGGEVKVLGTPFLSGNAHGCGLLNLKKGEEQKEVLEAKDDEEKESEVNGEVEERVTQRVHET